MVKALGEIVKIVSGLEKKSKSSDCYYQHQILFFNSLTTYHFFYLLLYTPYIFSWTAEPTDARYLCTQKLYLCFLRRAFRCFLKFRERYAFNVPCVESGMPCCGRVGRRQGFLRNDLRGDAVVVLGKD